MNMSTNRFDLVDDPTVRMVRTGGAGIATDDDIQDIWQLTGRYRMELPYRTGIEHLIRNPRLLSVVFKEQLFQVPKTWTVGDDFPEVKVFIENTIGAFIVGPSDLVVAKPNYVKLTQRLFARTHGLIEETAAMMVYEAVHQYCLAYLTPSDSPIKIELKLTSTHGEAKFFRHICEHMEAIFHDSYNPAAVKPCSYVSQKSTGYRLPTVVNQASPKNKYFLRQYLNSDASKMHDEVVHTFTFSRIPGPVAG